MGKAIYFSEKELDTLNLVLGTYLNVAGVDYGVDEEYRSIETSFNKVYDKVTKALKNSK